MKAIIYLLIFIFAAVLVAGFALLPNSTGAGISVICAGIGGLLLAYFTNRRYEKRSEAERINDVERNYAEHCRLARVSNYRFTVRGSSGAIMALLVMVPALATIYIFSNPPHWGFISGGAFFAGIGLLILLQALPVVGKPLLVLTREGFESAAFGQIPWSAVEGIHLEVVRHKGRVVANIMMFRVPDVALRYKVFHPLTRLMHRIRLGQKPGRIHVQLRGSGDDPELVLRVAKFLWTKRTGRNYLWNPAFSDEFNSAERRLEESRKQLEQARGSITPEAFYNASTKMNADFEIVSSELQRKSKQLARTAKIGLAVMIAAAATTIAVKFLK